MTTQIVIRIFPYGKDPKWFPVKIISRFLAISFSVSQSCPLKSASIFNSQVYVLNIKLFKTIFSVLEWVWHPFESVLGSRGVWGLVATIARHGAKQIFVYIIYSLQQPYEVLLLFGRETEAQRGYLPKCMQLISSRAGILTWFLPNALNMDGWMDR